MLKMEVESKISFGKFLYTYIILQTYSKNIYPIGIENNIKFSSFKELQNCAFSFILYAISAHEKHMGAHSNRKI
jgi:hypothetical protein